MWKIYIGVFIVILGVMIIASKVAQGIIEPPGGGGGNRVVICHVPPGDPANAHTISVSQNAVQAHLNHGDSEVACPG